MEVKHVTKLVKENGKRGMENGERGTSVQR